MPLYEYYCKKCEQTYELSKPMKDASKPIECESCGGIAERIMSAPLIGKPKQAPEKPAITREKIITKGKAYQFLLSSKKTE